LREKNTAIAHKTLVKQKDAGKTQKKKKNGKNSDSTPKERLREKKEETVVAHKILLKQKDTDTGKIKCAREREREEERKREEKRERETKRGKEKECV